MRKNLRKYAIRTSLLLLIGVALIGSYTALADVLGSVEVVVTPNFVPVDNSERSEGLEDAGGESPPNMLSHTIPTVFVVIGVVVAFVLRTQIVAAATVLITTTLGAAIIANLVSQLW